MSIVFRVQRWCAPCSLRGARTDAPHLHTGVTTGFGVTWLS